MAVLAALALAAVESGAQESGWTAPRTADGRPDLQGIWSNNTATPLERPTAFAGKESLTDEELAELQARAAELRDSEQAGNLLGDLLIQQVLEDPDFKEFDAGTGNYNSFWLAERQLDNRTSLIVDPPDGRLPAFTAAALERFGSRPPAGRQAGGAGEPAAHRALHHLWRTEPAGRLQQLLPDHADGGLRGVPPGADSRRAHHPDRQAGRARRVDPPVARRLARPLGGRHAGDRDGQLFERQSMLRGATRNTRVTERLRRVGPDTLEYVVTYDDPDTWERPWTLMIPLKGSEEALFEYACHEGNYAMEGILAGARVQEAESR